MSDYALLQMWMPFRERLIASHEFYVREARDRLLAQFTEAAMKSDADSFAKSWLEKMASRFNPDRDDPGEYYERAYEESIDFYLSLEGLKVSTRLSIIAGMYHEWEKQLRDWLARELMRVLPGQNLRSAIWLEKIDSIIDLFEGFKWPIRSRPYYHDIRTCYLVVNIYKHGNGTSLKDLEVHAPELVGHKPGAPKFMIPALDYTHLSVDDTDLARFSDAIIAFWRDVPENIFQSQISTEPRWITKAIEKDAAARK
jgi:hypothetical protein